MGYVITFELLQKSAKVLPIAALPLQEIRRELLKGLSIEVAMKLDQNEFTYKVRFYFSISIFRICRTPPASITE